MTWPTENIPDEDLVFKRIHKEHFRKGKIKLITFRETGPETNKGISCNWGEYSSPEQTHEIGRSLPEVNGVISFIVREVRELDCHVIHDPISDLADPDNPIKNNQAHSLIKNVQRGADDDRRLLLSYIAKWEIPIE